MIGIYKIISPSNKIYIGQSVNIKTRWRHYKGLHCKDQPKIYNSLKKYGPENHIFEIIEECKIEELDNRELYWKVFYLNKNKKDWSQLLFCELYDNGGGSKNKGRKQSLQERKLRSKIRKGFKPSKSHIENMRQSMLNKNTKKIICTNTGNIYNSIREASKLLEINERAISNNLLGYSKTTYNLSFEYV